MLKLRLVNSGESFEIIKIKGSDEYTNHLQELGFCKGNIIDVISSNNGDMTIKLMDTRYSLTRDTTENIYGTIVEKENTEDKENSPKVLKKKKSIFCISCPYENCQFKN